MTVEAFELGTCIARGSQGNVCLAINKETGEEVVGKVVDVFADRSRKAFLREVNITQILQGSDLIVKFYDATCSSAIGVLLLEKMDMDLLTYILESNGGDGVLEVEAAAIFCKILRAVLWCHQNGVAHLDLKPENVLMNAEGEVKLADFGAALSFAPDQTFRSRRGTELYCAPEMDGTNRYCPKKADTWSLGVLLHVLVFGRWPFPGEEHELEFTAGQGIVRLPIAGEECSDGLTDLLSKMLCPSQERESLENLLRHQWLQPVPKLSLLAASRAQGAPAEPSPMSSARVKRTPINTPTTNKRTDSDLAGALTEALQVVTEATVSSRACSMDLAQSPIAPESCSARSASSPAVPLFAMDSSEIGCDTLSKKPESMKQKRLPHIATKSVRVAQSFVRRTLARVGL